MKTKSKLIRCNNKNALIILFILLFVFPISNISRDVNNLKGILTAASKIDRQAEKRCEKQKKKNRDRGFQDIEIDNLHGDIERRVFILDTLISNDKNISKISTNYKKTNINEIDINTEMRRFNETGFVGKIPPGKLKFDRDVFIRVISELLGSIASSKKVFTLPLGLGITVPEGRKRYLYKTVVHIFTDQTAKELKGIVVQFDRVNATGNIYIAERRLLINPNPDNKVKNSETNNYIGSFEFAQIQKQKDGEQKPIDSDIFDYNGDILIEFYTTIGNTDDFRGKPIFTERLVYKDYSTNPLHAPMPYSKQLLVIEGYKKYLRRTKRNLEQAIRDYDLKRRDRIGKMMQFLHMAK